MSFVSENRHPESGLRAFFEDDGRAAYLYLVGPEGKIVSDVWLYNRGEAPEIPEWKDPSIKDPRSRLPFTNPQGFASERRIEPVARHEDLSFVWGQGEVVLRIRGEVMARLPADTKPGFSKLALKDGPLAKVLPA